MEVNTEPLKKKNPNSGIYGLLTFEIYLSSPKKIEDEKFDRYLKVSANLLKKEFWKKFPEELSNLFRKYFQFFADKKKYIEGKKYFLQFKQMLPKIGFHPFKGYILFFSYLSKDYSEIDDILYQIMISANFVSRMQSLDFSLYSFYKGEILLNRKNFIFASLSFCYCVANIMNNKEWIMDVFQIECIKRLCLLNDLLPKDIANSIDNIFSRFQRIKGFKELIPYLEYNEKKEKNKHKLLEVFIGNNKKELKKDNILGLAKIALKELKFKYIQNYLRKYKRIKMSKLSNITEIEYPILKNILEWYVCNDKINIKFNEEDDVIDIYDVETGENLEEIKKFYEYLNQVSYELCIYDKEKIAYTKEINSLTNDEKLKLYTELNKKSPDEIYQDDD